MKRSATFVLLICLVQLAAAAPCMGSGPTDPGDDAADHSAISADFGPTPLAPARSDGGSSTSESMTSWAAPEVSVEVLPQPIESIPVVATVDMARSGYPHGVERPPKSSS